MKNFAHIAEKLYNENWLLRYETLSTFARQFEAHIAGNKAGIFDDLGDDENDDSEVRMKGSTMIIPVHGVLGKHLSRFEMMCGGCSVDALGDQIKSMEKDFRVDNAILDFRTPGGQVIGTPELAKIIAGCDKSIFGFADMQCCSAGIWLASQCSEFYCTETAKIGAVGVYSLYLDRTKQMEAMGVKVNAISAGEFKLTGAPFRVMSDEEKAMLKTQTIAIHEKFKAAVTANHNIDPEYLEGQIFDGEDAADYGFVDGIVDNLDEVVAMMQ